MSIDYSGNWFSGICLLIAGHILQAIYTPEATRRHLAKLKSVFTGRRSPEVAVALMIPTIVARTGQLSIGLEGASGCFIGSSRPPSDDHYSVVNELLRRQQGYRAAITQTEPYRNIGLPDSPPNPPT